MEYRRFGRTEKQVSVFTLGTMRFVHGWDEPHNELPEDSLQNCHEVLQAALDAGVNLIETAKGYGKSERLIGQTLPKLRQKRSDYMIMTKATPPETGTEMRQRVEDSLRFMDIDHIELFAVHGVNTRELHERTIRPGGPLEALQQMQREGLIGHIGVATHAPLPLILEMIASDLYDFINLHYYIFKTVNRAAVDYAAAKDMGLFIISPNDKGGRLYTPSERLAQQTAPLHPANYNERWILSHPHIHTMTVGMSEPHHPQIHLDSLNLGTPFWGVEERRIATLLQQAGSQTGLDRCGVCTLCMPCPEQIDMPEMLRLEHLAQAHDMTPFGQYRYSYMDPKDHWVPGAKGNLCTDCNDCLPRCPQQLPIPQLMRRVHDRLKKS
uniref:Putative Oxidoreductase, aldo/keto reductase family n=1 Tax=Magnetococcus massalia (strain MO-1) TaxID=451514 RepID=A0A1S7LLQ8_MAGMO|nr:putative Oxidoreductase, aldo/keto reductase family [Candidatus Magnetococcus massalia]